MPDRPDRPHTGPVQHKRSLPWGSSERSVTVSMAYSRCRPFVRRAVESVLGQTHGDLTLIVLNDGDVPGPWDLLADITDSRLVRFDLDKNRGRYFADAVSLTATTDQYFLVQDADDWIEPDYLAILYENLREADAGAAFSALCEHGGGRVWKRSFTRCLAPPPARLAHLAAHVGLYRASALRAIGGYYGGFRFGYDTLLVGLLSLTERLAYTDAALYHREGRADSLGNSSETGFGSLARQVVRAQLDAMYDLAYRGYADYVAGRLGHDELCRLAAAVAGANVTADDRGAIAEQSARLRAQLEAQPQARRTATRPAPVRAAAVKALVAAPALTRLGAAADPDISVVVPVRDEAQRLPSTIGSFLSARSRGTRVEFVIVDDDSRPGIDGAELDRRFDLKGRDASIAVIRPSAHIGIARARNLGAQQARADLLFLTDAHVRVEPGWDALVTEYAVGKRVLAATIVSEDTGARGFGALLDLPALTLRWNDEPAHGPAPVPVAAAAGMVISRRLYSSVGGFDSGMIGYGSSPAEFSVRAWLRGAQVVNLPQLAVWHRFRGAAERATALSADLHLMLHNRLRFALLYLPEETALTVVRDMAAQYSADVVARACALVAASDVWTRRQALRERELMTFGWFARTFGLDVPSG